MDPNLLYWKSHGLSFLSRLRIWVDLLDPTFLFASNEEIQEACALVRNEDKPNEKERHASTLSLTSVNSDSGGPLPLIFRPPALFLSSLPLITASLAPHLTVSGTLISQFVLQSYFAGFNRANRNSSSELGKNMTRNQVLSIGGAVSFATCVGSLPRILIKQLPVRIPTAKTFVRLMLPIPLSAALAFFSVVTVRNEELQYGIQVFDSNGNRVGLSKAAGEKAVRETALSRASLCGTATALPNLMMFLLWRRLSQNVWRAPMFLYANVGFVLALMIPISLSIYPQLGTIKKEQLEEKLWPAAGDGQLYYHRGL